MNRNTIFFLFALITTGFTIGVYASLAGYPPAVPAALQGSRQLVLVGETAALMLFYFILGFMLFAVNNGIVKISSALALVICLAASGYGIFYLVSTPGLLFRD